MLICLGFPLPGAVFDVRQFDAKGDGVAKDTKAIQATIDAAANAGGGIVSLPAGKYLAGTLRLKSNITVHLDPGATLIMSPDKSDFDPYEKLDYNPHSDVETAYFHYGLITGENIRDVAILGEGVIDGNRSRRGGPKPIALKNCRHVTIRGITIRNAPNYAISFLSCDFVVVDGVTIRNAYADGIDPDCSRYVRISNCFIDSGDDAIVPKSSFALGYRRATEHITVTNCVLMTAANHFKLGTESGGDFHNIAVSNCVMMPRPKPAKPDEAGIAVDIVDGGHVDGLVVSNISMFGVNYPLFIRLGTRATGPDPHSYGTIGNVSVSNVVATDAKGTATISGLPGHPVGRVNLSDINITMMGGVHQLRGLNVPEAPDAYAWPPIFGVRPSYGLYARHIDGLTLRNLQVRWQEADVRPALIFDDVAHIRLDGFQADTAKGSEPVVWMNQVRDALIRGSSIRQAELFLRLSGNDTHDIKLFGNDLSGSRIPVEATPEVPKSAWSETADIRSGP